MQPAQLLALADANLAEFARQHARWLPPTHIEEHTDLLLAAAGTRAPGPWNAVMALGPNPADPERALAAAAAFFDPLQHHCAIYVRAHLDLELELSCRRLGYELGSDAPGMVLGRPAELPQAHTQPRAQDERGSLEVRLAQGEHEAQAFVEVAAEAYESLQIPAALTRKLLSQTARWRSQYCESWLLFEGGRAVSAAQLLWSHGIAGLYWVATLPAARGRGHGERVTRAACRRAFAQGARAVVLQASRAGEAIYRRIGFAEITRYRSYRRPIGIGQLNRPTTVGSR